LVSPESPPHSGRLKLYVLWALAAALAANAAGLWTLLSVQPLGMDFLPLWTAGRFAWSHPGQVYDFAAVSHAQGWLLPGFKWLRPFANPPTALLLLAPLGALPFWPAQALWTALGVGVFGFAGARLAPERPRLALVLIALCPAVVIAAIVGQSVLLASALMVLAIAELERRPRLAGGLIALAAAIKPQIAMLAPVALIAGGAIEALVSAAVIELLLVVASAVIFGPARWNEWLTSLPAFQAVIDGTPGLTPGVITAGGAAHLLGLTGWIATLWRAFFALIGIGFVWWAFARKDPGAPRLAALAAGSLLAAPYAMHYDGALLVPAAVALAIPADAHEGWTLRFAALVVVCGVTAPSLGFAAVLAFAVLVWRSSIVESDVRTQQASAARLNPGGA
jgi:hypothetical protein